MLARVFAPSTDALLADAGPREPAMALDLGCGPGWTTRRIAETLRPGRIVGIDRSEAFLAEAKARGGAEYAAHDAAARTPLPHAPADLIFCRFLLSHLSRPEERIATWRRELRRGGRLLVEELAAIRTEEPAFGAYLALVEAMLAAQGTELYIGATLKGGQETVLDRVFELDVERADAARMFSMNVSAWRENEWVRAHRTPSEIDRLAADIETAGRSPGTVRWELRQLAWEASR